MVYNEIQAAYILRSRNNGLRLLLVSTKHYHCVCFRLSSHLNVLYICLYTCASVQLDWHSHGNTNKIADGWASKSTRKQQHLILPLTIIVTLYDRGQKVKIQLFQNMVMLHINLKRIKKCSSMVANILPTIPYSDLLSGLIWVQTVCKGYQQTTLVNKELK